MSTPIYQPSADFVKNAHISGMPAYEALCKEAETDYEGYWARLAKELITWKTPFTKVLDESNAPFFKWFEDGTLNASYNCLDRNVEKGLGDKTAIIFEADGGEVSKVTYSQLLAKTCQYANALKSLGIKKGDRVVIYISMSVEGVAAMQACARIGATHSVVFGGFRPNRCATASKTRALSPSSPLTTKCAVASCCPSNPSWTTPSIWAAAAPSRTCWSSSARALTSP
jgi:acetyl-CoA synthetase